MANNTIYPFGPGGQTPVTIPIADDLNTDSAQEALSARQGVVLKGMIEEATQVGSSTPLDLSSYTEKDGFPAVSVWSLHSNRIETHITIPVTAGQKYTIKSNATYGSLVFLLKQDDVVTQNLQVPSFADGVTERIVCDAGGENTITIPETCNYMAIAKSYTVANDYFPQGVSLESSDYATVKQVLADHEETIEALEEAVSLTAIDLSQAENRNGDISTTLKWQSGSHKLIGVESGRIYYAQGTQYVIWLKNDGAVVIGNDAPVSDYAKYQVLLATNGVNEIVSPPDANFMLFVDLSSLMMGDAYAPKSLNSLINKVSYLVNRSAQYMFNEWIRGWGDISSSVSDVLTIHEYVATAKGLAQLVASGEFDNGLVFNTKHACLVQARRLSMRVVNCHTAVNVSGRTWGGAWQSGQQAAWAAVPASLFPELFSATELTRVRTMLAYEADRILGITQDDDLYWSTDPTSYDGDSRADDDSWNAECLAMAVDMLEGYTNYNSYKRRLVELSIIANSMPSDKNTDININGYNLQNLRGYNYLDNGLLYNHNIVHPDYMMSWVILCATTMMVKGMSIPVAINHNIKKILHSLIDVDFVAGSVVSGKTIRYPGGTIYKEGSPMIYYPMGNDWAKTPRAFRPQILGGVRGYVGDVDDEVDWSRMATALTDFTIGLKKRFLNGGTYQSGDECDYRVTNGTCTMWLPESVFIEQLSCALICLTFPPIFTEDAWVKYTVSGTVSGVNSGTLVFAPLFGDEVSYSANITNGAFSIELGGGRYGLSITGYTLNQTSVNVTQNTQLTLTAS